MYEQIKRKLATISNEVNDLHPLLEALLPKLPSIVNVDYTHGPHEKGADFVVSRCDPTFGDTEYVGIIAKLGQIKQNNTDVQRQIDECELGRYTPNGKSITLSEVWVITTGTITQNAREVINHKFKYKKVKWVDLQQLTRLVETYMPNYWANIPMQVGEYLHDLRDRNIEMDMRTSLAPEMGRDFYIDQLLHRIDPEQYSRKAKRRAKHPPQQIVNVIEENRFVVIEGPMGSGKSKLLRQTSSHFADPETYADERTIPLLLTFKEIQDKFDGSALAAAKKILEDWDIAPTEQERLLIMVDALDEYQQSVSDRQNALAQLLDESEANPDLRIVLTSRRIFDTDVQNTLSRRANRYVVAPLSLDQVGKFIEAVCKTLNIRQRILQDLKRSPLFKVLPRTPISAIILGKLLQDNIQDLPANMTELYNKYIELALGRWDIGKGLQSQKEFEASFNIATRIAEYTLLNQLPSLGLAEAEGIARKYLDQRNLGVQHEVVFNKLLERSDILYLDKKNQTIYFKHKTFQEYFYAARMTRGDEVPVDERFFDLYWINTYFFYVGLRKDCPGLLRQIAAVRPTGVAGELVKLVNLGNYLLAGYLSPYQAISDGVYTAVVEAARSYNAILKDTSHPLARYSQMQLLAIFVWVLKDAYGYEFFKYAIEESLLRADSADIREEERVLALFFLEVLNAELGGERVFENLLERAQGVLPLRIQLAIGHEAEYRGAKSQPIKKLERRLRRSLVAKQGAGRRGGDNKIKELYEMPISQLKIT